LRIVDASQKTPQERILDKRESKPHSAVELFEAAQEEWDLIDQGTIDKWIDEMPRRLQAVLAANGGHTKW
jgi:hypothetical protein